MSADFFLEIADDLAGFRRIQIKIDLLFVERSMHLQTLEFLRELLLEFFNVLGVAMHENHMLRFDFLNEIRSLIEIGMRRKTDIHHGHIEWNVFPVHDRFNRLLLSLDLNLLRKGFYE